MIPQPKPIESWASGFQWGILLVITTAAAPGHGWAFWVWIGLALLSCIPAGAYMIRVGRYLRQSSAKEVKEADR